MKQFAFLSAIAHRNTAESAFKKYIILDELSKNQNLSPEARSAIIFAMNIIHRLMVLPLEHRMEFLEFLRKKNEDEDF